MQETTNSPILWDAEFRDLQLAGSPTLPLARQREAAIRKEWQGITAGMLESGSAALQDERYNEEAFVQAFTVVLACSIYLPSAQCFALLPYVSFMQRTGNDNGCTVDYDLGAALQGCSTRCGHARPRAAEARSQRAVQPRLPCEPRHEALLVVCVFVCVDALLCVAVCTILVRLQRQRWIPWRRDGVV